MTRRCTMDNVLHRGVVMMKINRPCHDRTHISRLFMYDSLLNGSVPMLCQRPPYSLALTTKRYSSDHLFAQNCQIPCTRPEQKYSLTTREWMWPHRLDGHFLKHFRLEFTKTTNSSDLTYSTAHLNKHRQSLSRGRPAELLWLVVK